MQIKKSVISVIAKVPNALYAYPFHRCQLGRPRATINSRWLTFHSGTVGAVVKNI